MTTRMMTAATILILGVLASNCAHRPASTSTADPCIAFRPLYWSGKDTRATKDQADSHNRVWKRLCAAKVKP